MPYDTLQKNVLEIINEVIGLILSYHMMLFTDFVLEEDIKFKLGYLFMIFVGVMVAINIGVPCFDAAARKIH